MFGLEGSMFEKSNFSIKKNKKLTKQGESFSRKVQNDNFG